ncbi:MAG: Aspartyl/glutamyl-tRNA(Asn/Gln) amidotransferase subunit [Bacilli bacterium]|nr:Aspartyl/glutamyl-tRNA(Asn/Gln) amidotransferase subunit [Bacilli bacterium]
MIGINQFFTIAESAALIADKQLSPSELLDYFLHRIEKFESRLNTFITVMVDAARQHAKQAETEIMAGNYKGPLHGIPISLKDIIAYADYPMTNGSRIDPEFVPTTHATVTQKLIDAGAVIVGKAHLHEFAFRGPHPYYGWTRNPWNMDRVPGGSSSGSGSAVQAAFVLGSIGTDTGGSIRNPASFCGVTGLKPTYGRVSRNGVSPLSWSLDHVGPLTRTCEDAAILLQAIAGYDPKDESSYQQSQFDLQSFNKLESLQGKKLGVPSNYFYDNLAPDVEFAVSEALKEMERMGAEIIPIELEGMEELRIAHRIILNSEAYAFHQQNLEEKPEGYGPGLRLAFEMGQYYSAASYVQAQRLRTLMRDRFKEIFAKVDVLVTPTNPTVAKLIQEHENDNVLFSTSFTALANFLGLPALSIPCGFSGEGMPVGLQIMGRPFAEGEVLSIGHCYQAQSDWHKRLPNEEIWIA